ncbi:MAG: DUF3768 domain-containing protein [Litoreibacter sp.]|nr:DUF3768 domain-containing protein [Litoreibacter sp.]
MPENIQGRFVITRSIAELGPFVQRDILNALVDYRNFQDDDECPRLHSSGQFDVPAKSEVIRVFWRIDLFDPSYTEAPHDPNDTANVRRVLTLMLAQDL